VSGGGVVRVPGDKSISHRALILAALATGESRISGILQSADVTSTAAALRRLGVGIPDLADEISIEGKGLRGLAAPGGDIDAGNSGTTVRLMSGVVAAHPFSTRFIGDASLSRRPMKRIAEPLTEMGARFEFARGDGLPMTVFGGRLSGISWNTRAASAQTKSALLLAGLVAGVPVTVRESRKSRDHTERMLTSLGATVTTDEFTASLSPVDSIGPLDLTIPGDPSSASYFVALAILSDVTVELPQVCLNKTRIGFFETMKRMGAALECTDKTAMGGDAVATVRASGSALSSIAVSSAEIPSMIDELPLLACVAAGAGVELAVRGAAELRVKESDRIAAVVSNLQGIGATAEELEDGFVVRGHRNPLAGRVTTHGDHRIAMSFGVLGALRGNRIEVDDRDCVAVSYPRFWTDLEQLRH
jgi:3-phosphoshikimate 1-carboxyvinyltransferase